MRVGRKFGVRWCVASVVKWAVLAGETKRGDIANSARRKWGVWAGSLSRCSHFLAHLWAKFKGLFYPFYRSFILSCHKIFLFHRGFLSYFCSFFSSFCSCFSFYRSFNSSFYLQKAFFRALCFFEIFKCFVFGLFAPFLSF